MNNAASFAYCGLSSGGLVKCSHVLNLKKRDEHIIKGSKKHLGFGNCHLQDISMSVDN